MENNELKKVCIKNCTYCYFDDIIKLEDFDIDNILIDEKSQKNTLRIRFNKIDRFIGI